MGYPVYALVPLCLTMLRLVSAPLAGWAFWVGDWSTAVCVTCIAAATDFFDGWIARAWNCITPLGGMLDPIADKFFVALCYGALVMRGAHVYAPPLWVMGIFGIRECMLCSASCYHWWLAGLPVIRPSWIGKCTMVMHMFSVFWAACMAQYPLVWGLHLLRCGWVVSSVGMVYSAWEYHSAFFAKNRWGVHEVV